MTASHASQDGESTCKSHMQLLEANHFKMGA